MRSLVFLAVAATLLASPAHARLFWQTYGATVASPTGCGCAWNLNQDYFVPRHCDSCRYDLFSPCKTSHSRSPACRSIHPVYASPCTSKPYCTPYGECHYKRRDHVYAKHCGCTPLSCTYGKWKLDKCPKHGCKGGCAAGTCAPAAPAGYCGDAGCGYVLGAVGGDLAYGWPLEGGVLPNVEPFEGESLGTVAAYARAGMPGGGISMPATPAGQALPPMGLSPTGITLPMMPVN
jgi:hypothetical protein